MPTPHPEGAIVARSARQETGQNELAPHRIIQAQNCNHPRMPQGGQT